MSEKGWAWAAAGDETPSAEAPSAEAPSATAADDSARRAGRAGAHPTTHKSSPRGVRGHGNSVIGHGSAQHVVVRGLFGAVPDMAARNRSTNDDASWFWGLRLHLIAAPWGLPVAHALTGAEADERDTCLGMITHAGIARQGQTLIADNRCRRASFEHEFNAAGITLIGPAAKTEPPRPGRRFLRPLRQIIESVNWTLKSQLGLERHRGRTRCGVAARILQRLLALTAAICTTKPPNNPAPPAPYRLRPLTPWN